MTPKESDLIPEDLVAKIEEWERNLSSDDTETFLSLLGAKQSADGWLQVYSPGSIVAKRDAQNILRDIEIVGTELVAIDGPSRLFYRYKARTMQPPLSQRIRLKRSATFGRCRTGIRSRVNTKRQSMIL